MFVKGKQIMLRSMSWVEAFCHTEYCVDFLFNNLGVEDNVTESHTVFCTSV